MQLDSCRELKNRLRGRMVAPADAAAPSPALGIAEPRAGRFRLAVRVRESAPVSDLLAWISEEARGEADVVEVGEVQARSPFSPDALRKPLRPLVPGCSVGHPDVTAGTLGAFVEVDGALCALSNNHVLGNTGRARIGDPALQPGVADGGRRDCDRVGELAAMSELSQARANVVDAAIARIDERAGHDPGRYPGGPVTGTAAEPGGARAVEKVGRTTGHTRGRITAFEVDGLRVSFPGGTLVFDDQLEVSGDGGPFSAGGDSGSLIWTGEGREAVGLLFAGSRYGGPDGTGLTYANPIGAVLEAFGARLAAP